MEALGQQIPEDIIHKAMALADTAVVDIIKTQKELVKQILAKKEAAYTEKSAALAALTGVEATAFDSFSAKRDYYTVPQEFSDAVHAMGYAESLQVYSSGIVDKAARSRSEGKLRSKLAEAIKTDEVWGLQPTIVQSMALDGMMHKAFRAVLLEGQANNEEVRRSDGRATNEVRKVGSAVEVLPSVHGSSYFARGDTHVLSTVTLASLSMARTVTPIDGSGEERVQPFMLHYDFPPYSTGEMGNATATNRRMIGHGNLAEKGLRPVMPSVDDFPYAVRVFCECTGSNGSSSMASACGGTLALLDAGVPLKANVAAVSVGLVTSEEVSLKFTAEGEAVQAENAAQGRFVLLKDILGSEDYNGDMDYKIAGGRLSPSQVLAYALLLVVLRADLYLFLIEHNVIRYGPRRHGHSAGRENPRRGAAEHARGGPDDRQGGSRTHLAAHGADPRDGARLREAARTQSRAH